MYDSAKPGSTLLSRRSALGGIVGAALVAAPIATAASASAAPVAAPSAASLAQGMAILGMAKSFAGRVRYRWGGTSPRTGFDCSGMTQYVYARQGIRLPRTAAAQRAATRRISRGAARPGDLIFFHRGRSTYHVGIYAGGSMMVDAGNPRSGIRHQRIWSSKVSFGTKR